MKNIDVRSRKERGKRGVCLLLLLCTGLLVTWRQVGAVDPGAGNQSWEQRLEKMNRGSYKEAFSLALSLADLPPEEGYKILVANWHRLSNSLGRRCVYKAWYSAVPYPLHARLHPRLLDVLSLGVTDPDDKAREWAMSFLARVSFQDFTGRPDQGRDFCAANRHRAVAEVMVDGLQDWTQRSLSAEGSDLLAELKILADGWAAFRDVEEVRIAAGESDLPQLLRKLSGSPETRIARSAVRCLGHLRLPADAQREILIPLLDPGVPTTVRGAALEALGQEQNRWAVDELMNQLKKSVTQGKPDPTLLWANSRALGTIGDPRCIPLMIAAIEFDSTYATVYGVGYFGLRHLTQVSYDESHDGAWWRLWWHENRKAFPDSVSSLSIPVLSRSSQEQEKSTVSPVNYETARERTAGGDEKKRFFLLGPDATVAPPEEGYKLVIVIPGGDGGADFLPFVERIYDQVFDENYLVAELIAPRWDETQFDKIVWPTRDRPWPGMRFSTEDFVASVIDQIGEDYPVSSEGVFTLSWSSGGPAAYAISLASPSLVSGSFIAMSVFRPADLPSLDRGKGHAYFLYHSPADFIPIRMARDAVAELSRSEARVKLMEYEGGHGWRGDVFKDIGRGFDWIEGQVGKDG